MTRNTSTKKKLLKTQKKASFSPSWLTKIPMGSHGSNPTQKRYWKIKSDQVRIRDFYEWHGKCISCDKYFHDWKELQAGHYKSWASCRGYSKWDELNLFGQCGADNRFGDGLTGEKFTETIIKRHGKNRLKYIKNLDSYPSEKMEDHIIVERIKGVLREMAKLPEQPDYYYKIINSPDYE